MVSGEVDITAADNGRIFKTKQEGAPLELSCDRSLLQPDYWLAMKGSPNKENAAKFLAYMSHAKPQAGFAQTISFGPMNNDAYNPVSKEMIGILPGSPELVRMVE
ncbi:extracellular solute-binding protein [Sinorhizobium meliloti]|uniref:extracellular solute-binding protein n=1 Tax=Rhizobium meliloti TaxID=382 RepID=UPI000FD6D92A|nr:extracellular solute-binding protein [Sinorhizobium meliloti]RVG95657.1 extracellular solute-binding protein [Sinorhizobium meliloti]